MAISQYWVGQKPARPLSIDVRDSRGQALDVGFYTDYKVRIVGSDNEDLDLGNGSLQSGGARSGRFVFVWPTDKSLFNKAGEYLLQLQLTGPGVLDLTTTHTIRVREVGRVNN